MGELNINWSAAVLLGTVSAECVTNTQTERSTDTAKMNARFTFRKVRRKSNIAQVGTDYMYGHLDMYIQGSPVEIQTNPLESDRPQRDSPSACVIVQQNSSPTFVSLFSFPREKLGALLENVNFFFITENLCTSGSVGS
jgi:hypothetical protein